MMNRPSSSWTSISGLCWNSLGSPSAASTNTIGTSVAQAMPLADAGFFHVQAAPARADAAPAPEIPDA